MSELLSIRMRVSEAAPGWVLDLSEHGLRASFSLGPFGRTVWLIKGQGEAIEVVQGKNTGLTTRIANPTPVQRVIASRLVATGIASLC